MLPTEYIPNLQGNHTWCYRNFTNFCRILKKQTNKQTEGGDVNSSKKVRTESAVILCQMSFCGKTRTTNKQHGRMCNKIAKESCLLQATVKDTRTTEGQAAHKTTFQFIVQYVKSSVIWRRTFDHLKETGAYQTGAFLMSSIWRSIRIRERCQPRHQKFLEWFSTQRLRIFGGFRSEADICLSWTFSVTQSMGHSG